MDDEMVRLTFWVPRSVRHAMKVQALEHNVTDRAAWLMAARAWGVSVPDAAIEDRRATRSTKEGEKK